MLQLCKRTHGFCWKRLYTDAQTQAAHPRGYKRNIAQTLQISGSCRLLTEHRVARRRNRFFFRPWRSHGWAGSGQQPLTSPSCPDSAPAYPWRFCGCKTLIFNDTDLRRWKRWSRGQTHGSCEKDSPGHVRHRPGKDLKWRPLQSWGDVFCVCSLSLSRSLSLFRPCVLDFSLFLRSRVELGARHLIWTTN